MLRNFLYISEHQKRKKFLPFSRFTHNQEFTPESASQVPDSSGARIAGVTIFLKVPQGDNGGGKPVLPNGKIIDVEPVCNFCAVFLIFFVG